MTYGVGRHARAALGGLPAVAALVFGVTSARAENVAWPEPTTRTLEPGRVTVSLFSPARWGVTKRTELGVHPLWFFGLPHVELKHRFADGGTWSFATQHRLSYPTRFLELIAGEGAGALLPADAEVPVAIELDSDAVLSTSWQPGHLVTLTAGFAAAPRLSGSEPPLLDFPFLMSRFASLYTAVVPRAAVHFSGRIWGKLRYESQVSAYYLALEPKTVAVETVFELGWVPSRRVRWTLGLRREHLRYPVGYRTHALPYADFSLGF